jgi:hypothetical protein
LNKNRKDSNTDEKGKSHIVTVDEVVHQLLGNKMFYADEPMGAPMEDGYC